MNGNSSGWIILLLAGVLVLQIWILSRMNRNDTESTYFIQKRDSVLEMKIDSLNTNIKDYIDHQIYVNSMKLNEQENKIIMNKTYFKEREKELLQNTSSDSVYYWIKHRLHERTGH